MIQQVPEGLYLRQIFQGTGNTSQQPIGVQLPNLYPISAKTEIILGRDPSCEVIVNSQEYVMVSRRHAMIQAAGKLSNGEPSWEICDLNSSNGTYVNGRRIKGCQKLTVGDRISLSKNGPEFILEYITPRQNTVIHQKNPGIETSHIPRPLQQNSLTFTPLFPIVSTGRDLTRKAYLIPGSITVLFVVLMFATLGNANLFNLLLGAYLGVAGYYCVYQLCGKRKPWWWLLGSAIATSLVLLSPLLSLFILVFREILPGSLPDRAEVPFLQLLIAMFFGAGLMEELLKSLPVLMALAIGRYLRSPWRERLGVWEPLENLFGTHFV